MKQIEVAQLEYFKVFLEDLLSLITLHIYSVNTQLQQVVFCYLNTNKLFLWETNAPIGVTSCSIWKLWIYGAGVKQINRIWCKKFVFQRIATLGQLNTRASFLNQQANRALVSSIVFTNHCLFGVLIEQRFLNTLFIVTDYRLQSKSWVFEFNHHHAK